MSRLEIWPFGADHLDEAAGLLAVRHAARRGSEPLLDARYEAPSGSCRWSWTGPGTIRTLLRVTYRGFLVAYCTTVNEVARHVPLDQLHPVDDEANEY